MTALRLGPCCALLFTAMLTTLAEAQEFMTIDCKFETTHVVRLENGKAGEVAPVANDRVTTTFTGFDPASKTVMVVGNLGASKARYDLNDTRLVIVEVTDGGNVMVTTIEAPNGRPTIAGVHTRNSWIGPGALISTMPGVCSVR